TYPHDAGTDRPRHFSLISYPVESVQHQICRLCWLLRILRPRFWPQTSSLPLALSPCHHEVLLARIAAGNPPDATVLWTSPTALAARGSLLPFDALMQKARYGQAENWPPAVLASCWFAGKTYGQPPSQLSFS